MGLAQARKGFAPLCSESILGKGSAMILESFFLGGSCCCAEGGGESSRSIGTSRFPSRPPGGPGKLLGLDLRGIGGSGGGTLLDPFMWLSGGGC